MNEVYKVLQVLLEFPVLQVNKVYVENKVQKVQQDQKDHKDQKE